MTSDRDDQIRECLNEIERLREENAALRMSSDSFADLAERLHVRLQDRAAKWPAAGHHAPRHQPGPQDEQAGQASE